MKIIPAKPQPGIKIIVGIMIEIIIDILIEIFIEVIIEIIIGTIIEIRRPLEEGPPGCDGSPLSCILLPLL